MNIKAHEYDRDKDLGLSGVRSRSSRIPSRAKLAAPMRSALSEHLKTCAGCREAREHVALTPRLLHLAEATADPGPGFSRDVMARMRTDRDVRAERGFWQPLVSQ